jgi:D-alanine-D-alanine ligase
VPAALDAALLDECARVAVAAHQALGLRELSRSDLIVDDDGTVWFLEVNVAPGFTETSLVPLSVEAAGLDLGEVLAALVGAASARDARTVS